MGRPTIYTPELHKAIVATIGDLLTSLKTDYETRGLKSLRHCLGHLKPVREFFGERRVPTVTSDLVRLYIAKRKADGRSDATVNREVELLHAAFALAVRERRLNHKPHIPRLRERNARRGFFERHEFEKIVPLLPAPINDMARFAYVSGWRLGEIRTLKWENVDRTSREIVISDTKNGEGRLLPLDDEGWTFFEGLWELRRYTRRDGTDAVSEFVFHRRGKPMTGSPITRAWIAARNEAGLPGKLFHDLRRTAVRNLIRAGVPQSVAMTISGHKTDSMFRRYNVTSSDDQREALRKQREYLAGIDSKSNVTEIRPNDSDKTRTGG